MKKNIISLVVILALLNIDLAALSQSSIDTNSVIESAEVQWVDQFPSVSDQHPKRNLSAGKIFSWIAGANTQKTISLIKPVAIFAETPGDIWVADQATGNLFRIKNEKADVPRAFSKQKFTYQSLVGICSFPAKGILFTDSRENKIFVLKPEQKSISIFSDSLTLKQPTGIAFYAPKSEVWVVETAAHCITILDENGKKIKSFGKRGFGKGEFNFPTSIWIDNKGYAYIVDALNYRIQIFDNEGNYVNGFGESGNATGYFAMPKGIATDSYGNIYVVDALFHVVQIFDKHGHFLYSFGGQGREQGQFWMPTGIFIDKQDTIYIADSYNSRIQSFSLINIVKK
jgi:DNA-binding beta-propeller fold protein YncE